jgi:hypothetical protein
MGKERRLKNGAKDQQRCAPRPRGNRAKGGSLNLKLGAMALTLALSLPGCGYLWGESQTLVDLYNPQTRERARCGLPMHRGSPSETELTDRNNCLETYRSKGFRPMTMGDLTTTPSSSDEPLRRLQRPSD